MSTLTLVRHGQATPFDRVTDRLSATGEAQARALARYWLGTGKHFTHAYSGTLERQRRTAEIAGAVVKEAGRPWPDLVLEPGFDEYDGDGLLRVLADRLAAEDRNFAALRDRARAARGTPEQNKYFQRVLEAVAEPWQRGELRADGVEPWRDFAGRVDAAFARLLEGESGRDLVVFTSGGVIGRVVQRVLDAPDRTMLALNWRVKNASFTSFTFGAGRVSLDSFNGTAHLQGALETFR